MVVAVVLMVAAVGCTTLRESGDEYYDPASRSVSNRVYVEDPYRGVVVLERDPYTGRYYEVNSFGNYYGNGRYYDRNYDRSGYRSGRTYDSRYYRSNTPRTRVTQPAQQPSQEQLRDREKNRDEARRKVLGN